MNKENKSNPVLEAINYLKSVGKDVKSEIEVMGTWVPYPENKPPKDGFYDITCGLSFFSY